MISFDESAVAVFSFADDVAVGVVLGELAVFFAVFVATVETCAFGRDFYGASVFFAHFE